MGGNDKKVTATGVAANKLHHYWDTEFVDRLGSDPKRIAQHLTDTTTAGQIKSWSRGNPESWATQSYELSKRLVYRALGEPNSSGIYTLSDSYVTNATNAVSRQLARAGVRLAMVLNEALE